MSYIHTYSLRPREPTAYADFFAGPDIEETPRKRGLKRKRSEVDDIPSRGRQRSTTGIVKNKKGYLSLSPSLYAKAHTNLRAKVLTIYLTSVANKTAF